MGPKGELVARFYIQANYLAKYQFKRVYLGTDSPLPHNSERSSEQS